MSKRINILLCDTFPGILPACGIPSYVSMFTRLFDAVGAEVTYLIYPAMDGFLPTTIEKDGIYLITGCNLSVYDDVEWIHALLRWIESAAAQGCRIAGICFGHQAVAQALGGRVERATAGWGIGARESQIVDDEALAYFPDGRMRLLYNHHDQVTQLPAGATLVATSQFCPVESFRIGQNVLTFQGHPEYVPQYEEHLLRNFAYDEPPEVRQSAMQSLAAMQHQGVAAARWILDL